jgi:predicted permease
VFTGLVGLDVAARELQVMAGAALAAIVASGVVGYGILRAFHLSPNTYLSPLMFANTGNLGLPLCLFAFGEQGLALGVAFFAVNSIAHYSVGVWLWSGRVSFTELLRTPLFYAVLLAVGTLATDARPPGWFLNTTELLGGFTIPLMLITLGVSLGELRLGDVPRTLALSALRLALGLGIGLGLATWLELEGAARGVVIIECAMPVAVFNYLFAERYGRSPEAVASMVVLSTILAFALLPLILRLAV